MGRKRILKKGVVDLIQKRREADENKETKTLTRREKKSLVIQEHTKRFIDEREAEIHPLVVAINGVQHPVVDPSGLWPMHTTPYLSSNPYLILHYKTKANPRFLVSFDIETFQLRAGVLHHGMAFEFADDDRVYDESNYDDVR